MMDILSLIIGVVIGIVIGAIADHQNHSDDPIPAWAKDDEE